MEKIYRSPNFEDRRHGLTPNLIILHATQMESAMEALAWLCNPTSNVSAHYFVCKDGKVHNLVDVEKRAWHAGEGCWREERDVNSASIGIEIDNNWVDYEPEQITALIALLQELVQKHRIDPRNIIAHSDVAPHRKEDPGAHFPWHQLANEGLSVQRDETVSIPDMTEALSDIEKAKKLLFQIGYNAVGDGHYDFQDIIRAFQQHFVPENVTGNLDLRTWQVLHQVAAGAFIHDNGHPTKNQKAVG